MKKLITLSIVIFYSLCFINEANAQVRVTNEGFLQIDYSSPSSISAISFGYNPDPTYLRGKWGIEYWGNGLNFWIPWPNSGYSNYKLFLEDASGYVGINEDNPSYHLDVNGDIATFGTLRITSDKRFKSNIKNLNSSLEKLKKLNGVSFDMKKSKPKNYDLSKI